MTEQQRHETIADIVAAMRARAECALPYDDGIVMMLTVFAGRLEAAAKRERAQPGNVAATATATIQGEREKR